MFDPTDFAAGKLLNTAEMNNLDKTVSTLRTDFGNDLSQIRATLSKESEDMQVLNEKVIHKLIVCYKTISNNDF